MTLELSGWTRRKNPRVGPERRGGDVRIATVIFGATHREPIAKAIQLLGVQREHRDAVLEERVDRDLVRGLQRHRNFVGRRAAALAHA